MIRWEYDVMRQRHTKEGWLWDDGDFATKTLEEVLGAKGRAGWELVAVSPQRFGEFSMGAAVDEFEYIFKRPEC